jgi:hypothetical protein
VAFRSGATDLTPLGSSASRNLFARHLRKHRTDLVNVNVDGTSSGNRSAYSPTISADGSVIAFHSRASDLHKFDTDPSSDVFARSLITGSTDLVSVNTVGTGSGDDVSGYPAISPDGTIVAFYSRASNLHQLDTDSIGDVFARSLITGSTDLVSVNTAGTANGDHVSRSPTISADGTVIAFGSRASDLHPLDMDDRPDVFARSLITDTTALVSLNADGTAGGGNANSVRPFVSADGNIVVFESDSSNLVAHDFNLLEDVFFADLATVTCDFDSSGSCDIVDLDLLVPEIASGLDDTNFDLTGDGVVDLADRDAWLAEAGAMHLVSGNAYLLGDANLDGTVDGLDFIAWNTNKFTVVAAWSAGDFTANGVVDGLDFIVWNSHKFQTGFFSLPVRRKPHREANTRSIESEETAYADPIGVGPRAIVTVWRLDERFARSGRVQDSAMRGR